MKPLVVVAALIAGVGALYLARGVLIPIALATLLTFMVHPLVGWLARLGLGRAVSVTVVVTMLFAMLGGVAWVLATEFAVLSTHIPAYRDNLIAKIAHVRRLGRGGPIEKTQTAVTEVAKELQKETAPAARSRAAPAPVVVQSKPSGLWQLPTLIEALGGAATVIALVIFMLIEREDLRNRVIRLVGYGRLATTTRALDEAAQRISRYLLMQSVINAFFGAGIMVGLLLFGVPYAPLWGFLAAVLRFIPYVGVLLAALLLIVFALAAFPTWQPPLLVAGLVVLLETLCSVALEPLLYGHSAGVSQVALLCSIAFWTWLWGPMGLLLATPLTVCLVVFAKHVPGMEFVGILMADVPPIAPSAAYYQRLLAEDQPEAVRIVADYAREHPIEAVYDNLILPALSHARRDRRLQELPESAERYIWQATREIVQALHAKRQAADAGEGVDGTPHADLSCPPRQVHLLASPVRDEADALGLLMLGHLVDPARWTIELTSPHLLASEVIALVEKTRPAAVCLGALPASGLAAHTRYLCKRLRARFPDLRIVVGRWGLRDHADVVRRHLEVAGASHVGTTLVETRAHLQTVYGLEPVAPRAEVRAGLDRASRPASPRPPAS
ncbi:MAG TPA: AI-2E family transporter [Methylomirabilota bacterium]|nr:AI-2E family transporter [Methylomirabilota bacterium]